MNSGMGVGSCSAAVPSPSREGAARGSCWLIYRVSLGPYAARADLGLGSRHPPEVRPRLPIVAPARQHRRGGREARVVLGDGGGRLRQALLPAVAQPAVLGAARLWPLAAAPVGHAPRGVVDAPGRGGGAGVRQPAVFARRLQSGVTGERSPLFRRREDEDGTNSRTNGKWFVNCDQVRKEITVVQLPQQKLIPGATAKVSVVPICDQIKGDWNTCILSFCRSEEDRISFCFHKAGLCSVTCQFVIVDLAQTIDTNTLAVLSSTAPHIGGVTYATPSFFDPLLQLGYYLVLTKESGTHSFVCALPCYRRLKGRNPVVVIIEEGTGNVQMVTTTTPYFKRLQVETQLSKSQFCVITHGFSEVWDVNDNPMEPLKAGSTHLESETFFEGGLIFEIKHTRTEIHVKDEHSGADIMTFKLFRPFSRLDHHSSFLY
ncbi:hypothetical protein Pelo_11700 [Pelomyxa schiedti]|nr:hypothetical protein Pelo_11700 [Pelomyxa schiedti]